LGQVAQKQRRGNRKSQKTKDKCWRRWSFYQVCCTSWLGVWNLRTKIFETEEENQGCAPIGRRTHLDLREWKKIEGWGYLKAQSWDLITLKWRDDIWQEGEAKKLNPLEDRRVQARNLSVISSSTSSQIEKLWTEKPLPINSGGLVQIGGLFAKNWWWRKNLLLV